MLRKKIATGWFNLNNAKENTLEDDIIVMLKAEAELVTNNEVEDPIAVHNSM